jgi:hypothetical protein
VKGILKWPLVLAAVVVILRVVVEQSGGSNTAANLLSVVALHLLIGPLYFAMRIAKGDVARPYAMHFKLVTLYVLLTRAMILPTYWLARIYGWPQPRFSGLSGPGVSPFVGYVVIPFATAGIWIVASVLLGGLLGSMVIAIYRRLAIKPAPEATR